MLPIERWANVFMTSIYQTIIIIEGNNKMQIINSPSNDHFKREIKKCLSRFKTMIIWLTIWIISIHKAVRVKIVIKNSNTNYVFQGASASKYICCWIFFVISLVYSFLYLCFSRYTELLLFLLLVIPNFNCKRF